MKTEKELFAEELYYFNLVYCESFLGTGETNTDQLNAVGFKSIPKFRGTYARDEIPKNLKKGESICLNEGKLKTGGWHWLGLYRMKNGQFILYDSFARDPKLILGTDKINGCKVVSSDRKDREQRVSEFNCGCRSLAFLIVASKYGEDNAILI